MNRAFSYVSRWEGPLQSHSPSTWYLRTREGSVLVGVHVEISLYTGVLQDTLPPACAACSTQVESGAWHSLYSPLIRSHPSYVGVSASISRSPCRDESSSSLLHSFQVDLME